MPDYQQIVSFEKQKRPQEYRMLLGPSLTRYSVALLAYGSANS